MYLSSQHLHRLLHASPFVGVVTLCLLLFLSPTVLCAEGLGSKSFGRERRVVLDSLKLSFGAPLREEGEQVIFAHPVQEGVQWDEGVVRFADGLLIEARFVVRQSSKAAARRMLREVAEQLSARHSVSHDVESDGNPFYMGGRSPAGLGRLFTLYVAKWRGQWSCQLRYGPFAPAALSKAQH